MLSDAVTGVRFLWHLPGYLRRGLGTDEARAILARRLERREEDFLALIARAVYARPSSPYRTLLRLAGCEQGDLERLVRQDGVEGALRRLLRHGVYITVDEFKGRRPVVRGGVTLDVPPGSFRNPCAAGHALLRTGGSRGSGTPVPVDLAFIHDRAVDASVVFEACGGLRWRRAVWGVPGGAATIHAIEFAILDGGLACWFSTVSEGAPGLHPRYRWSARALSWGSRLAGRPISAPQHVPFDDPLPVAQWMASVLRAGAVPHLHTFASAAAQLCDAALEAGVNLAGARFTMASEPITAARLAVVRRAGADALPYFASVDCGPIGYGCRAPSAPDDLHLLHDFQAVIQPEDAGPGIRLPGDALLISTLRAAAPFLLLNVSLGDRAVVDRRSCGCPLEKASWGTHIREVRSFEKLTAGGMTFLDVDLVRILEEVLPGRFGGGPMDYQLVEEELDHGRPGLRLLVHPRVGPLDARAVIDAFLDGIGRGSGAERVMALAWRDARIVAIERRPPIRTAVGKILHLHVGR